MAFDEITIRDICRRLGVTRTWVYEHIDPAARRRCALLDGDNRERGRIVAYPESLVGAIVSENARAFRSWQPYDFSENAPDKAALADAFALPWRENASAWTALRNAVAPHDRALLDAAASHGPRRRAKAVEVPVPEQLRLELEHGDFKSLRSFGAIRSKEGLCEKSDEMVYRSIYSKGMLRIAVFGRVWYYDPADWPEYSDGKPHAVLEVPVSAFSE